MRLLLDTHVLIWWWLGDERLSRKARVLIADEKAEVFASAISAFEIATKVRIGKLPEARAFIDRFDIKVAEQGFVELRVSTVHARHAGLLAGDHRDPFDRILAAQALVEDVAVVTSDEQIAGLGPRTIW